KQEITNACINAIPRFSIVKIIIAPKNTCKIINNRSVVTDHIITRLLRYRFVILTKKTTVQTKSKPAANRCPICTHTSKRFENINESGELYVQEGQSTHTKLASACRTSVPLYTTINVYAVNR